MILSPLPRHHVFRDKSKPAYNFLNYTAGKAHNDLQEQVDLFSIGLRLRNLQPMIDDSEKITLQKKGLLDIYAMSYDVVDTGLSNNLNYDSLLRYWIKIVCIVFNDISIGGIQRCIGFILGEEPNNIIVTDKQTLYRVTDYFRLDSKVLNLMCMDKTVPWLIDKISNSFVNLEHDFPTISFGDNVSNRLFISSNMLETFLNLPLSTTTKFDYTGIDVRIKVPPKTSDNSINLLKSNIKNIVLNVMKASVSRGGL
jgi:hypothetical protein